MAAQPEQLTLTLTPCLERQFYQEDGKPGMTMKIYDPHLAKWWQDLEKTTPARQLGYPHPIDPNTKDAGMFQK